MSFTSFPTEPDIRGEDCSERAKKSKDLTKRRKDSKAGRPAIPDTAFMQSKGSTEVRSSGRSLWRNVVAGILTLVIAMGIGRFAYTPILPAMQQRFDLSNAVVGALASSNYFGYLLGAILVAFVPAGRTRDLLLQTSLWTVAMTTILMGLSTNFPAWVALRFVAGLAGAGVFVLASTMMLDKLSQRDRPGLSGVLFSGVGIGIALSGLVVLLLNGLLAGDPTAWRADWLVLGTLAFVLVIPCRAWLPRGEAAYQGFYAQDAVALQRKSVEITRQAATRATAGITLALTLLCFAYFLEGAGYIVTGTFLPAIVERLPGLGDLGSDVWILVGLAAAPSSLLWAGLALRMGAVAALAVGYVAQAAGILLPVLSDTWLAGALSGALLGGTFVGISALTLTYTRQFVGTRRAGLAIGLLTAVYGVGQVVGPLVAAHLTDDAGNFGAALVAASAVVVLGSLLMLTVGFVDASNRTRRKENAHTNGH